MKIEIKSFKRHEIAGNPIATMVIDGVDCWVIRQANLNIWSWPKRNTYTREQLSEFDAQLNDAFSKSQRIGEMKKLDTTIQQFEEILNDAFSKPQRIDEMKKPDMTIQQFEEMMQHFEEILDVVEKAQSMIEGAKNDAFKNGISCLSLTLKFDDAIKRVEDLHECIDCALADTEIQHDEIKEENNE